MSVERQVQVFLNDGSRLAQQHRCLIDKDIDRQTAVSITLCGDQGVAKACAHAQRRILRVAFDSSDPVSRREPHALDELGKAPGIFRDLLPRSLAQNLHHVLDLTGIQTVLGQEGDGFGAHGIGQPRFGDRLRLFERNVGLDENLGLGDDVNQANAEMLTERIRRCGADPGDLALLDPVDDSHRGAGHFADHRNRIEDSLTATGAPFPADHHLVADLGALGEVRDDLELVLALRDEHHTIAVLGRVENSADADLRLQVGFDLCLLRSFRNFRGSIVLVVVIIRLRRAECGESGRSLGRKAGRLIQSCGRRCLLRRYRWRRKGAPLFTKRG